MSDTASLVFYFLVFTISVFFCRIFQPVIEKIKKQNSKFKKIKLFLIILIITIPLVIVAAMRSESVGADTKAYMNGYEIARYSTFEEIFSDNVEDVVFNLIQYFCSRLFDEPYVFMGVMQLLALLPLMILGINICDEIDIYQIMIIYCFWYYGDSLNAIRQVISIGFLLLAFYYLNSKKINTSIVMLAISVGFHSSALLIGMVMMITTIFLMNSNFVKKVLYFLALGLIMLYASDMFQLLVQKGILPARYKLYIDTFIYGSSRMTSSWVRVGKGVIFEIAIRVMILIALFVTIRKWSQNDSKKEVYLMMYFINIVIYMIGVTKYNTSYFVRLSMGFDYYVFLLLPLLDEHVNFKFNRRKLCVFTYSISVVYWVIHTMILGSGGVVPYIIN